MSFFLQFVTFKFRFPLTMGLMCIATLTALSQRKPELVVQAGHSEDSDAIVFTSDGNFVVTGSEDGAIKIWEAATGLQLRIRQERRIG